MIIADGKVPRRIGFGESCSVESGCVCVCKVANPAMWRGVVEDGSQPPHSTKVSPHENVFQRNAPLIGMVVSSAVL